MPRCGRPEAISAEDAAALTEGAGFLRSVDHIIRLVTGKAPMGLPENGAHAETAESVARRWNLISEGQTLAGKLQDTRQRFRYVYRRLGGLRVIGLSIAIFAIAD